MDHNAFTTQLWPQRCMATTCTGNEKDSGSKGAGLRVTGTRSNECAVLHPTNVREEFLLEGQGPHGASRVPAERVIANTARFSHKPQRPQGHSKSRAAFIGVIISRACDTRRCRGATVDVPSYRTLLVVPRPRPRHGGRRVWRGARAVGETKIYSGLLTLNAWGCRHGASTPSFNSGRYDRESNE